ncbi:MAG: hypothetical protein V1869_04950 [Candidatus Omnitrophota bacterium]
MIKFDKQRFRYAKYCILLYVFLPLAVLLSGCVSPKEAYRGFLGVSTKVLEDGRKDAIKKEFNLDLITCHNKVRSILKDTGSYIYADDLRKDMIAVYVSEEDTTPVGLFFTQLNKRETLIEVSSPSTYGKEKISGTVFDALITGVIKPAEKGQLDAVKIKTKHK